ncbi:chromo domain-containing protein [Lysobacter olei]
MERILDEKRISGNLHYLVKWKGYDNSENTYEPMRNLRNATQAIEKYHQMRDLQSKPPRKDPETRRNLG